MCNCISEVEANLEKSSRNTKLDIPITFSLTGYLHSDKVTISTCKRDEKKREKPLRLFAAFCPFCGVAYESEQAVEHRVQRTADTEAEEARSRAIAYAETRRR